MTSETKNPEDASVSPDSDSITKPIANPLGEPWVPPAETWKRRFTSSILTILIYVIVLYASVTKIEMLPAFLESVALNAIVFLLGTYGLVTIVVQSEVAHPFRELAGRIPFIGRWIYEETEREDRGLLSCPLCVGQWVGSLLPLAGMRLFSITDGSIGVRDLFVHGLVAAGFCWLLHVVTEKLGASEY